MPTASTSDVKSCGDGTCQATTANAAAGEGDARGVQAGQAACGPPRAA